MSQIKVKFLKAAAGPRYSASAGQTGFVPTEDVKALLAADAIIVIEAKSEAIAETAQAPVAPENASATPSRRGRRVSAG